MCLFQTHVYCCGHPGERMLVRLCEGGQLCPPRQRRTVESTKIREECDKCRVHRFMTKWQEKHDGKDGLDADEESTADSTPKIIEVSESFSKVFPVGPLPKLPPRQRSESPQALPARYRSQLWTESSTMPVTPLTPPNGWGSVTGYESEIEDAAAAAAAATTTIATLTCQHCGTGHDVHTTGSHRCSQLTLYCTRCGVSVTVRGASKHSCWAHGPGSGSFIYEDPQALGLISSGLDGWSLSERASSGWTSPSRSFDRTRAQSWTL